MREKVGKKWEKMSLSRKVKGISTTAIVAILAVIVVVAGLAWHFTQPPAAPVLTGVARIKDKGVLVVGIDVYPPWVSITEEGGFEGFDVDVMKEVAEAIGVDIELKEVVWETIIPSLLAKEIDVIASALSITPARSEEVLYTIPYYEVSLAFVVRADEVGLYSTTDDFIDKNVGAQAGTTGWDLAQTLYGDTGTNILDFPVITDLLLALEGETVDVGIFDAPTASHYCEGEPEKFAVAFTHPTHPLLPDRYAYAVRPEDGDLAQAINTVILDLMASGELLDFMETWGV